MRSMDKVPGYGPVRSRIGKMIDGALDYTIIEKRWPKKWLSPSMFPICSVQEYAKQLYQQVHGGVTGSAGTMLNIFAKAGTGMHESLQNSMGHSGQFYGHWKCVNKKCEQYPRTQSQVVDGKYIRGKHTRLRSTNNICPSCGDAMAYDEFKVLYKKLKGYVDGIIDNLDGTYSLIDFKSTTVTKAADGSFFVAYHQLQIATYAWVLKKRYGLNIIDYTLIYVPRDNPKKFVEKTFVFDDKEAKRAKNFLMVQMNAWRAVLKSAETHNPKEAIKHKPCASQEFYWNKFHGYDTCPFVDFCFIPSRLTKRLEEIERRIKADPQLTYMEIVTPRAEKHQKGLTNRREKPRTQVKQFSL